MSGPNSPPPYDSPPYGHPLENISAGQPNPLPTRHQLRGIRNGSPTINMGPPFTSMFATEPNALPPLPPPSAAIWPQEKDLPPLAPLTPAYIPRTHSLPPPAIAASSPETRLFPRMQAGYSFYASFRTREPLTPEAARRCATIGLSFALLFITLGLVLLVMAGNAKELFRA